MKYYVEIDKKEIGLEVLHTQDGTLVKRLDDGSHVDVVLVDFAPVHSNVDTGEGLYSIIADGKSYQLYVEPTEHGFRTAVGRSRIGLSVLTEREWRVKKAAPRQATHSGEITISAPMPGLVKAVLVAVGDAVTRGQRLLVLEAMKMENEITTPVDGKITRVNVQAGAIVEGGKPLISVVS
jgi:biotin carboxyl carrier protein